MADPKTKTPLLDELEKGPWPSFVTEIKKTTDVSPMCDDLLGQLELSYEEKKGHWKHGGIVGVLGYGGGVIGRYSDIPEQFPQVAHFHTMRVNQPSGWFYTSDALRTLSVCHAAVLSVREASPVAVADPGSSPSPPRALAERISQPEGKTESDT